MSNVPIQTALWLGCHQPTIWSYAARGSVRPPPWWFWWVALLLIALWFGYIWWLLYY